MCLPSKGRGSAAVEVPAVSLEVSLEAATVEAAEARAILATCETCRVQLVHQTTNLFNMGVSKNSGGPPKSSILIGFSIINHPFGDTPIFGNTHMDHLDNYDGTALLQLSTWPLTPYLEAALGWSAALPLAALPLAIKSSKENAAKIKQLVN